MLEHKIQVKVSGVNGIRDPEGNIGYKIDFVEVKQRPPMVMMTPPDVPEEIGQVMVQVSKGLQTIMPGGASKEYELQKVTIILTVEELEAFDLKPYPNQIYELTISPGNLHFRKVD